MEDAAYLKALEQATSDLSVVEKGLEQLERKRANLRQTIKTLRSLLGRRAIQDQTVTDAILEIVKATDGYVSASEVLEAIDMAGYIAGAATVATTLSRLVKEKQLEKGPDGGYRWAGIEKWTEEFGKSVAASVQRIGSDTRTDETVVSPPAPNSLAAMDADGQLGASSAKNPRAKALIEQGISKRS